MKIEFEVPDGCRCSIITVDSISEYRKIAVWPFVSPGSPRVSVEIVEKADGEWITTQLKEDANTKWLKGETK
jgi:hypothetical protein